MNEVMCINCVHWWDKTCQCTKPGFIQCENYKEKSYDKDRMGKKESS